MATNINEFRIPLEGVESEHCALIVDNGLAKLRILNHTSRTQQ